MDYKSNSWNIIFVEDKDPFLINRWLLSVGNLYKYHSFPDSMTKNLTELRIQGQVLKMHPVFLQATRTEIEDFTYDIEPDFIVIVPHNDPIDDRTMRLAIYLSGIRPSDIMIAVHSIKEFKKNGRLEEATFGTAGSFQGYRTNIDGKDCFCLPFGSNTLVIKEHK